MVTLVLFMNVGSEGDSSCSAQEGGLKFRESFRIML